jgi:hypothetical protein
MSWQRGVHWTLYTFVHFCTLTPCFDQDHVRRDQLIACNLPANAFFKFARRYDVAL